VFVYNCTLESLNFDVIRYPAVLGTKATDTKNFRAHRMANCRFAPRLFHSNEISRDLNIRQGTVSKILRRHSQRRTVKPKTSSGRPRKTSARDDRILYRICRRNRKKSASVLRQLWQNRINIRLSRATVNRRLFNRGFKACRPVQRPLLNDLRKQRRLLWAQRHRRYGLRYWRHVIYTDESRFLLHRSDGRVRVRRQQG
jgi:transposase